MASTQNLASGVLASSISSSTTTISVNSGSGSATTLQNVWPDPPFYATIMPTNPMAGVSNSLDSEVVLITAATGTSDGSTVTMTAERGKKGTTAKAFSEGAVITNGIYAETGVFTATKNGTTYTISDVRAPMPSEGVKILVKFDTSYTNTTAPSLVVNGYGSGAITMFGSTFANATDRLGAQISKDFVYQLAYTNVGGTAIWQVLNVHNNIQTADIADSAVTTTKIADSAVTSDKIDFTTFKFGMKAKVNDANLSFTAPSAGTLYVFGMASYMWGYGGGSIRLGYTKLSGTASIGTNYSTVITGGNTVSRSISCMATVPMSKGDTINMALARTDGASTGTSLDNYGHFYFFVPS